MKFSKVDQKVNFPSLEKKILKTWEEEKVLEKYLGKNRNSSKKFRFLDGPITANNPMGVHHAWGRTLKDLWQRFYNMRGYKQRFQNGFDEQGLWVEVEVEKEIGIKTKKDIENLVENNSFESIAKFVNLCKERVKKYSRIQTQQSQRLGYFMNWDNSYHTSSDQNNYSIWQYLKRINQKGWLYKGRDTVPWCPRCGTAISQHEILTEEYQEISHKAVFVKYKLLGNLKGIKGEVFLLVWTTTPWTLPSNVAIAVNPELDYQIIDWESEIIDLISNSPQGEESQRGIFVVARNRTKFIFKDLEKDEILKTIKGSELMDLQYQGVFDELPALKGVKHKVVASKDLVTEEEGTGLVHIAPGAGEEDFDLAQEEKLPVIASIDESANYIQGFGDLTGKNAKDSPDLVIEKLKEKGTLFKIEDYPHRYPICWRCKTELVWRVVDEWYISMDRKDPAGGKTYRQMMKEVIKDINWIPKWGYDRELDWLNNMHDWLISKKRYWGLALPIWECKKCGNFEVVGSKEELKEKAVTGREEFEGNSPHRPWVDQVKIKCSRCGEETSRIPDVGNPWLDAGIVPFSTLKYFEDKDYWQEWFPVDFITESFPGQFKNWFYSLIAMSTVLAEAAPFNNLLGHGQVRDERGEEMHKSKGNSIEFNEAADEIGVDVMRWLYLRTKPEHNVNFGYHVADEIRRLFLLRFWNVYVFFTTYAILDKWSPKKGKFAPNNVLDKWILSRLNGNIKNITGALDGLSNRRFDATDAIGYAEVFVSDLSNWYVRRIRDRVGPTVKNGEDKDDAYQTLWQVLVTFSKVLAPMVPFVSEEVYKNLTGEESVHLANWPEYRKDLYNAKLEDQMNAAQKIVEEAHSQRKEKKIKVRQPLASLTYNGPDKLSEEVCRVIADEVNVKRIEFSKKSSSIKVNLDVSLTDDLVEEGNARDLVRNIQDLRKNEGLALDDKITVLAPSWPKDFEEVIKQETLAENIVESETLKIRKN